MSDFTESEGGDCDCKHTPLDRDTLIDMLGVAELMLLKGKTEALGQHLAFMRQCLEVDLAVAQVIYARETEGCSEAFLCQ